MDALIQRAKTKVYEFSSFFYEEKTAADLFQEWLSEHPKKYITRIDFASSTHYNNNSDYQDCIIITCARGKKNGKGHYAKDLGVAQLGDNRKKDRGKLKNIGKIYNRWLAKNRNVQIIYQRLHSTVCHLDKHTAANRFCYLIVYKK